MLLLLSNINGKVLKNKQIQKSFYDLLDILKQVKKRKLFNKDINKLIIKVFMLSCSFIFIDDEKILEKIKRINRHIYLLLKNR